MTKYNPRIVQTGVGILRGRRVPFTARGIDSGAEIDEMVMGRELVTRNYDLTHEEIQEMISRQK